MTPQERKVFELALAALEAALSDDKPYIENSKQSITAIKEALAQPEQEPVAWLHWLYGPVRLFLNKDEAMMELDRLNREYSVDKDARQMKPLYTTPPQRKPLMDEQILKILGNELNTQRTLADFARRAIEAAHGIKE